ncbi:hypothetical protein K438DRAFT_1982126 [Mycena galopus ATCC 62051]|nr:hypothetical protein K438DRAFT_1982126 [Mycena galopus ATCC 62051]
MSAPKIRHSISVEEVAESPTRGAPPLFYSNSLLIPADEPDVTTPADAHHQDATLDATLSTSVLGKRTEPPSTTTPSAKALGKRRRMDPNFSPVQPPLEPDFSTYSVVTVQSSLSMPGSSFQLRHSPRSLFTSGFNPRRDSDFGDPLGDLPGYGALLTPSSMRILPVRLQDTPVSDMGECEQFVSTYTLNKLYHCVKVQSVRTPIRKGCLAASCTNVSLFVKQFTHLSPGRLVEIAASHHLQMSTRPATLLAAIAAHDCNAGCSGYSTVMVFDKLKRPRTVQVKSQSELEVVYDNEPRDDDTGTMSTYTLSRRYEYKAIGPEVDIRALYGNSCGHIICSLPNLGEFTGRYRFLKQKDLVQVALAHSIDCEPNKPALLQAFSTHLCTAPCPGLRLAFAHLMYPRKGTFPIYNPNSYITPSEPVQTNSLDKLGVLPILVDNTVQLDSGDSLEHLSTYLLNTSYDFVEVVSNVSLPTIHRDDVGTKYVASHTPSISAFIAAYHHLNVKQLAMLCSLHGLGSPTKKPNSLIVLMGHVCDAQCGGNQAVFLFKPAKKG